MIQILSSIYIPNSNVIKFTFDPYEKSWIQQVRYDNKINHGYGENIIFSIDNKILLNLTEEIDLGNVKKISSGNNGSKILFYININSVNFDTDNLKTATVYGVEVDTGYVYRVPHLYMMTEDGTEVIVLDESKESYLNIINLMKSKFPRYVENLLIYQNGVYVPFLESDFETEYLNPIVESKFC